MTDTQQPKKSNGAYIAVILILLLGLGAMAYLWSSKNSELNTCKNDNATLNADMNGMNNMLEGYVGNMTSDLKTDFKNMLETYDALIEKDKTQADSLNKQKEQIAELLDQVERGKMTARQLFKIRKENEELKRIMRGYIEEIDSLNTLNLRLTSDLDSTKGVLTTTTVERDNLKGQVDEMGGQLDKARKLSAYSFNSTALRTKLNNTMTPTNKARNARQIKSEFTIGENSTATSGTKTVYLQVITPEGKTLQSRSSNVLQASGGPVPYSDKKDINYNNSSVDVAVYYSLNGEEIPKGNYKVRIYCEGQLIGTDSFTLK